MPKGGVVLPTTDIKGSWFLAPYFDSEDPDWIVPIQSLKRGPPSFNTDAFRRFGGGFPDQELITAIAGRCVDPKDWGRHEVDKQVLFSAAHGSGMDAWRFVTEANKVEKDKQHLFGFHISVCPPVYPAMCSRLPARSSRRTGSVRSTTKCADPLRTSVGRRPGTGWSGWSSPSTTR